MGQKYITLSCKTKWLYKEEKKNQKFFDYYNLRL